MIKIAIIIPIYNLKSDVLDNCIFSILKQDYKNYKLILVDDGSSLSETKIKLESYKKFDDIVVLHKKNGGAPSARNYGLDWDKANYKSDYICFIDGDDYISPDYLSQFVKAYNETKTDIIICNYVRFFSNESYLDMEESKSDYKYFISNKYDGLMNLAMVKYPPIVMGKVFLSKLFDVCRFKPYMKFGDDTSFLYRIFSFANSCCYFGFRGYHLNRIETDESICRTKNLSNKQILSAIEANVDILKLDLGFINDVEMKHRLFIVLNNVATDAFLELIPRFSNSIASEKEKIEYKDDLIFIKENKSVKFYKPYNRQTRIKKYTYLLMPFFYKPLYRFYLRLFPKRYGIALK